MNRDHMQADVTTYCIHAACARALPYRVNFCPYCGTGQHAGVMKPGHALVGADLPFVAPAAVPLASVAPTAPAPVASTAPGAQQAPAFTQHVPPATQRATAGGTEPYLSDEPPPVAAASPARRVPSGAAVPPQRAPVRMRYWVLALALLWGIWIVARPSAKKIDARIDQAITMANECNPSGAQSELVDLRTSKATPAQLQRLQKGLSDAVPICEKRRQKIKAWSDASAATDSLLAAGAFDKALARLAQFTRRYGEDSGTRELKARIESQRGVKNASAPPPLLGGEPAPPAAAPTPMMQAPSAQSSSAQSARNLINDAEREMAQSNYKAAADRMDICINMVDATNQQCLAVKARAERLARELQRCLLRNGDWVDDRCQ
jgi:hypothetical protein